MTAPEARHLEEIPLTYTRREPSGKIREWIDAGTKRIEEFYEEGLGIRYRNFVPCDPLLVHAGIIELLETGALAPGLFCEWGSGFAMASGIANLLGFESIGIEQEEILVRRSREWIEEFDLEVGILETSYLPSGFEETEGIGGKDLLRPADSIPGERETLPAYEDLDPAEVDLFFVYPWPDQEQMMMDLFESVASVDAILMMYLGDGELICYRLVASS